MNSGEKKRDLTLYRLQQAEESLDEARFLFEGYKSPRSVIVIAHRKVAPVRSSGPTG